MIDNFRCYISLYRNANEKWIHVTGTEHHTNVENQEETIKTCQLEEKYFKDVLNEADKEYKFEMN